MSDPYEIRLVDDVSLWDHFVQTSWGGSPFSTTAWLRCATQALGGKPVHIGVFKGDKIVAGLAAISTKRRGIERIETPELTPHTGFLLAPVESKGPAKIESECHRFSELLIHYLQRYDHIRITHTPALSDIRPFSWAHWQTRVRYTYQMDLSDLNALWERVERRTRTAIRKAEKLGYDVVQTDDVDLLCRQYAMIYERHGAAAPIPAEVVRRFVDSALSSGQARLLAAQSPEGKTASIVAFVEGPSMAYAWVAGADPQHNSSGATSLLYWRYFEQSTQPRFDFVGANLPAVAFFKRGLGGDLIAYYATEHFATPWLSRAVSLKRLFSN